MVLAGGAVMSAAREHGAAILPIDSEHSGLFQCLEGRQPADVRRVTLTASGGAFRDRPARELAGATPAEALKHPVWPMGDRITIDSATLMNKGLEVLEAHWLFDVPLDAIDVVVHRQSIVHALVEFVDGSVVAQLAPPDMILPVQYALSWPERWSAPLEPLDLAALGRLDFEPPDPVRFPCLGLAYRAGRAGGVVPAAMNAADEVAVAAFLEGRLGFMDIPAVIEAVMDAAAPSADAPGIEAVLAADVAAREEAARVLARCVPPVAR
jgi:1-deoxy-D-xylulose-5-phosphate reductoisomerase